MYRKIITGSTLLIALLFNTLPASGAGYYGQGHQFHPPYNGRYMMPSRLGGIYPRIHQGPAYNTYTPRRVFNRRAWARKPVPHAMPVFRAPMQAFYPFNRYQYANPRLRQVTRPVIKKAPLVRRGPERQAFYKQYWRAQRTAYAPRWVMPRYRHYPRPVYRGYRQNQTVQRLSKRRIYKNLMANRLRIPRS